MTRIHKVEAVPYQSVTILLHGSQSDVDYVRGILHRHKGVTSEILDAPGLPESMIRIVAKGTPANPVREDLVRDWLSSDSGIDMKSCSVSAAGDPPVFCCESCESTRGCSGTCRRPVDHDGEHFCNSCNGSW
jgi:hypothetical protein